MKLVGIALLLVMSLGAHAQYDLPAKEMFDNLGHKVVYNGTYEGIVNYMLYTNPWSGYQYGEQVGPALEGYIRLYETTKDKAYLIKFVNLALKAVAWRKANYRFNDHLYMDGQLLWPIAHFIHLVLIDEPDIASFELANNEDLIQVPSSTVPVNELPFQSSYTLEEIANWLLERSVESLDAIIADEWDQDIGFEGAPAVNMQGGFAGALLHLGHMAVVNSTFSGLQSYFDRGARLAALFRSQVEIDDDCSCSSYDFPVLRSGTHNSYWWYHSGWYVGVIPSCVNQCPPFFHSDQPDLNTYQEYIEDISHAIPALIIPFMSHRYSVYTNGFYPFTDTELVRFRNTFTKHVWDANAGGFHNAVNGQDSPVYPPAYNGQFDLLHAIALAWMPLQRFDQAAGAAAGDQLYDVIMDYYSNEVHGQPTSLPGGFNYLGLAEVVAAQWERECFSLDLYNRELVYDQDFAAKKVLLVFPEGETGASFADPVINEPRFTVKENIHSQFRAGSAVIFEPGFEAEHGSVVEALIDPLGCDLAYKAAIPTYGRTEVTLLADQHAEAEPEDLNNAAPEPSPASPGDALRLSPNPSAEQAHALITLGTPREVGITLIDGTGRTVWSMAPGQLPEGEHRLPLAAGLARGIYHCIAHLDGQAHHERLLVE